MPKKQESRVVRLGEGARHVTEHGEEIAEPVQPSELEVGTAPKVTKTQARAAVNMKIAGAGYDRIAEMFSYKDAATARRVVEETIAGAFPEQSRESLRQLTGARIEGLMLKIAPKVEPLVPVLDDLGRPVRDAEGRIEQRENPEQLAHVKVMGDLISRHARVMGVETTDVTITPTNEQYAATMRVLLSRHNEGGAQEADPFSEEYLDAEVVEPEEGELDG